MDKQTLSQYGWVVICVLVLAVMIAMATPFGNAIKGSVNDTVTVMDDSAESKLDTAFVDAGYGSSDSEYEETLVAGLYDADGNLTISWDELKNTYNLVGTAELNGKTYTSLLGNYATGGMPESYFKTLEGVLVIDDEIENISGFALYECPGITKVICPNGLKAISANNFCYSTLEELQLGSSIEYISGGTFDYDTSKTLITYSESCANLSKVECYSAISVICNDGTLTSDANGTSWS